MTTETNTTAESKAKSVATDFPSRSLFPSIDEALAFISKSRETMPDFDSFPVVQVGFTEDGDFDPAVYGEGMQVTLAKMTEKGSKEKGTDTTVRALVIYPTPTLEAVLADSQAQAWLEGLIAKECNLVALRPLRKAETLDDMAEAQEQMPTTIADYVTTKTEASAGILATYNELWQKVKKIMGEKFRSFGLANLSKKELRKAMESASYAAAIYPRLESRTNKKGEPDSYFEGALKFGAALAKKEGLDPAFFDRALATRSEKEIAVIEDDEDSEEFDFEAEAAALAADEAQPAATTTEEAAAE